MGKIKDLTGQRFGKLVVIEDSKQRQYRQVVWKCQCDCGNTTYVVGEALRNGHTRSCGCLQRTQAAIKNKNDLIGKTFGDLLVIEDSGLRRNRYIIWNCLNSQNQVVQKTHQQLINYQQSCNKIHKKSCYKKDGLYPTSKDLTNQKFGKLLVIEPTDQRTQSGRIIWKCLCDCGNVTYVASNCLIQGNTTSCGCIKSKGEELITKLLQENNISFQHQKTFSTCRFPDTHSLAYFDFYISNQYLIEYDGSQHFKASGQGWNNEQNLKQTKERDSFKNQWCKCNHIPLIRIPYTHYNQLNINDLLLETSNFIL